MAFILPVLLKYCSNAKHKILLFIRRSITGLCSVKIIHLILAMRISCMMLFLILLSAKPFAQCKTYILGPRHDTLNCTDQQNKKQGKWVLHYASLRGEPGYEEEGIFTNNKKEGTWRIYSLMGDLQAIENYRFGFKNGISQYYSLAGLVREESWKAVDPDHPYDTIQVPDLNDQYKVELKVVKVEGTTLKHGTWKFFVAGTGTLLKSETYVLDRLEDPNKKLLQSNNAALTDSSAAPLITTKAKPKEVTQFEKKNAGKKKLKVRDGATGYQ